MEFCHAKENFRKKSLVHHFTWDKVLKNGPSKICGRQPLKNLKWYGLLFSTNFTWFILEYFFSFLVIPKEKYKRIFYSAYGNTTDDIKQSFEQINCMIYFSIQNFMFKELKRRKIEDETWCI